MVAVPLLKFLTQIRRTPKIVYKKVSVGRKRGFEWDVSCGALGGGRGLLKFWSGYVV